jgi:tape measure domain-containing protein
MPDQAKYDDFISAGTEEQLRKFFDDISNIAKESLNKIKKEAKGLKTELQNMSKIDGSSVKSVNVIIDRTEKLKTKKQNLLKVEQERIKIQEQLRAQLGKNLSINEGKFKKELRLLEQGKKRYQERINLIRKEAAVQATQAGSIARLQAETNLLVARRRQLNLTTASGRKAEEQLRAQIKKNTDQLKKYDAQIGRHQRNVGNYASALKNLFASFGIIISGYTLIQFGKNVFELTKKLDALDFSFRKVLQTQADLGESQEFLIDIADRYGLNLLNISQSYLRLRAATKQTNLTVKETNRVFESVNKAGAALGLTAQRMDLALLAVEQIASKGTVSLEELRRQLGDQIPGAVNIMAEALDVSIPKLYKMIKANEVLAEDALPKFAAQLEKTFGIENLNRIDNVVAAQGRMTTAWQKFVKNLKASSGFTNVLNDLAKLFGKTADAIGGEFGAELINIQTQLNAEVDAILIGNNTLDQRNAIIDKLNTQYSEFIKTKLKDEATNEDIEKVRKEANKTLNKQIELTQKEARYNAAVSNLARIRYDLFKVGVELRKEDAKSQLEANKNLEKEIKLNKELGAALNELELATYDYNQIKDQLTETTEDENEKIATQIGLYKDLEQKIKTAKENKENATSEELIARYQTEIKWLEELKKAYDLLGGSVRSLERAMEQLDFERAQAYADEIIKRGNSSLNKFKRIQKEEEAIYKESVKWWDDIIKQAEEDAKRENQIRDEAIKRQIDTFKETGVKAKSFQEEQYQEELQILKDHFKDKEDAEGEYLKARILLWLKYKQPTLNAINRIIQEGANAILYFNDVTLADAENRLNEYNQSISDLESRLKKEQELKEEGRNNDLLGLKKQITEEKRLRDKAAEDLAKAKKREAQIELLAQISNLITASSEIFVAESPKGVAGVLLAAGAIASMLALMAQYRAKIKSLAQAPAYAEGTEYLERGKSPKGRDKILLWGDEGERIFTKKQNEKIGNMSNDEVVDAVNNYKLNFPELYTNRELSGLDLLIGGIQEGNTFAKQLVELQKDKWDAVELEDRYMLTKGNATRFILK